MHTFWQEITTGIAVEMLIKSLLVRTQVNVTL
jgi:hypothetical protein